MKNTIAKALEVTRMELTLFKRFPKLRLSVAGIIVIPALYALIYLVSVWDPASRTGSLQASIVNLDRGTEARGQQVNLGADLARSLQEKHTFGFVESQDAEQARRDVRLGKSLFALIIPADFSANAIGGETPGAGKPVIYASEGNNYTGAGFAKRFAAELGHQVNEMLNEKRWTLVLGEAAGSTEKLGRLRDGIFKLRDGAHALDEGLGKAGEGSSKIAAGTGTLAENVTALSGGVKQLASGARTLEAKAPPASDLQAVKDGASQLAAGEKAMQQGLGQLNAGADKLVAGAIDMRDQTKGIPIVGGKVSAGAAQLADGAAQLQSGLRTTAQGQAKLAGGAAALDGGVTKLADGFAAYAGGVSKLASSFPADDKMDALARGSNELLGATRQLSGGLGQLRTGSSQLSGGLDLLADSLPAGVAGLTGTARGLAHSVEPAIEIDAPVETNGAGFAPNFLPVALWLGATMTAFIFHLRRLPESADGYPRASLLLGKLGVLWLINLAQAVLIFMMAAFVLQIHVVHMAGLALTMAAAVLTFMLLILALVRLFGDAGKAVALILLILQMSSAGGVTPVELTNAFYRNVSPFLPFTWVVRAVRASMFGAYGSEWLSALGMVLLFAGIAFLVAMLAGKWKFVPPQEHRPAMDI
ncbi:YhgE/Pip domain-containing protein [Noviherbaspirillum galbum]|uniref:YhgE/Pip domain-containing protein n=1 Tax=Noviherbaspirillum galbum TaxID=2709383 RepID=A0A6B3SF46_9BURK|nr:YhgE/Pip domain-containing protein [Noviherbaspirillum galbum]NEX59464.1 YhgE/Pip domain-containing protein [Noviherbaspirillum galbum]